MTLHDWLAGGTVRRALTLPVPPDALAEALATLDWLGDEVVLDRRPGGSGRVRDGGEVRELYVLDAGPQEVRFRWWRADGRGPRSEVRIVVHETDAGAEVVVEETVPEDGLAATARVATAPARGARWVQRLERLALRMALVPA